MRIELQVSAALAQRLGASPAPAALELPDGATVGEVLRRLGVPDAMSCLTLVNGQDATGTRALRAGDVVALYPPLAGGRSESAEPTARAVARRTP